MADSLFDDNDTLVTQIRASSPRDLDLSFLDQISDIAENRQYLQGDVILRQGETNTYLFILLDGTVGVYVSGECVSKLQERGDLIGEMSVISRKPVSATIVAETDVTVIAVPTDELDRLDKDSASLFTQMMDRVYASILIEKLLATNEKAKQFEITNRELAQAKNSLERLNDELEERVKTRTRELQKTTEDLRTTLTQVEQQNALLQASARKVEESSGSKNLAFSKLSELYHNFLLPLQRTIDELPQRLPALPAKPAPNAKNPEPVSHLLKRAHEDVQAIVETLQPLTQLHKQEKALRSKRVLFIDPERKNQLTARLALGGTGVELDVAGESDEGLKFIEAGAYDVVFVDSKFVAMGQALRTKQPSAQLVLMTSGKTAEVAAEFVDSHPVAHAHYDTLISRDTNDRTFTVKSIMATAQKMINRDLFGLEKYLAWGVDVHEFTIERSDQRMELIEKMKEYFSQLGLRSSLLERCELVSEELLMNTIYDAPCDENGKSLYNHASRQDVIVLKENERGTFRFACDGMLLALSVSDPFGRFQPETLFSYLSSCYGGQSLNETQHKEKGGAGRGLHLIVEQSDLVVFNVRKKVKTEVVALFNLDAARNKGEKPSSVHFFTRS